MKKIVPLLLTLVLCLGLFPASALAADSGFEMEHSVLRRYTGPGGDVVIPDYVNAIDCFAFAGREDITSVVIPSSVTSTIMRGGESGLHIFRGCTNLKSVTISEGLPAIGVGMFAECTSLNHIVIPSSVKIIHQEAFEGCTALENVTILNGTTEIENRAFTGCTSLKSITLPASVTKVGTAPFAGCTALEDISVAKGNPSVRIMDGALVDEYGKLIQYPPARWTPTYSIPKGVTRIGDFAFQGCTILEQISFPAGLTHIGMGAFRGCTSLKSAALPTGLTSMGDEVFDGCTALERVDIPGTLSSIPFDAFCQCTSLKNLNISRGVKEIEWNAFAACRALEDVVIPDTVSSIGEDAFRGTPWLENQTGFVIVNGILLDYRGEDENVVIPNGVRVIGASAFHHYDGPTPTSVTIPEGVTSIEHGAFHECEILERVSLPSTLKKIGNDAFYNCSSLENLEIPSSVTEIGGNAFLNTPWVDSLGEFGVVNGILVAYHGSGGNVTIPDGVTAIADYAFYDFCNMDEGPEIKSLTIPSTVTKIGNITGSGFFEALGEMETTIRGVEGSCAETFALEKYLTFEATAPGTRIARYAPRTFLVDGKEFQCKTYARKSADGTTQFYIRLRDLALILNGTQAQFNVIWHEWQEIDEVSRGTAYIPDGTENKAPFSGDQKYECARTNLRIESWGLDSSYDSILLRDSKGNSYPYFNVQEMCNLLNIHITQNGNSFVVDTHRDYDI